MEDHVGDCMNDICNTWTTNVSSVDLASVKVTQVFEPLTSCGIAVSYIPSLENALSKVTNLVTSVSGIITNAGEEQHNVDANGVKQNSESSYRGSNSGGNYNGGSNSGGGSYGGSSGGSSGSGNVSSNPSTSVNNGQENLNINTKASKL